MEMDLKFSNQHMVWGQSYSSQAPGKDQDEDDIAYVLAPEAPILTMAQGGKIEY